MSLIAGEGQTTKSLPEPWLAVNLSMFFPGIGQLYAGEKLRGIGFVCTEGVLIAIATWSIFSPTGNTVTGLGCLVPIAIVYILNLFDAYACGSKQPTVQTAEKIPRTHKDPWFAVFLSRILPGLGQLYIEKAIVGGFLLSSIILVSGLANIFSNLLIFVPIISAVACYHAFVTFGRHLRPKQSLITVITALVFAFGIVTSYLPTWIQQKIELFEIPSKSMLPTLQVGDKVFVNKSSSYSPQRGDLVVFRVPQAARILQTEAEKKDEQFFIKRVIGQPGQVVRIAEGVVYLDNLPLQESYITEPPAYDWGPMMVPAESYFVMGDNRNKSFDSHIWGFLPGYYLVGQAYKIFWPPERIQSLMDSK